jgi:hypothetical protein
MLIGLGTGSVGTAELARRLGLPHEKHWLPWEPDDSRLVSALPEIGLSGGEVGLYFLPYVEKILGLVPHVRFVCMQRDPGRTVRGLTRKLGGNPFAIEQDAVRFHHGFPFYGGVTLEEGASRFVRDYYARAYEFQRRFPDRFRVFFTDHLLGSRRGAAMEEVLHDLYGSVQEDFEQFVGISIPQESAA